MAYDTVDNVKSYLGLSGTTYDAFVGGCVTHLSELSDLWSNRTFSGVSLGYGFTTHSLNYTTFLNGEDCVILPDWPVVSVSSLQNDGVDVSGYLIDKRDGVLEFLDSTSVARINLYGKITVTFVSGFTTVPYPVKMFLNRGTSYLLQRALREGIGADLLGDSQVTFKATGELHRIYKETCGEFVIDFLARSDGVLT